MYINDDQLRGGLVSYDAAFTRLRSGVQLPFPVKFYWCSLPRDYSGIEHFLVNSEMIWDHICWIILVCKYRDSLVSYDAALIQLSSWVQFPILVYLILFYPFLLFWYSTDQQHPKNSPWLHDSIPSQLNCSVNRNNHLLFWLICVFHWPATPQEQPMIPTPSPWVQHGWYCCDVDTLIVWVQQVRRTPTDQPSS